MEESKIKAIDEIERLLQKVEDIGEHAGFNEKKLIEEFDSELVYNVD